MTKDEALKLALEALEIPFNSPYVDGCDLALGKKVKAITAVKAALANEALERKAENARELGLDYEPVAWEQFYPDIGKNQFAYLPPSPFSISGKPQSSQQEANEFNPDWDTQAVLTEEIQRMAKRIEELEAKDEPVAAECKFDQEKEWGRCSVEHHNLVQSEPNKWPDYQTRLLYATPPQRKPLSDETIGNAIDAWFKRNSDGTYGTWHERMRAAIKAAHGIIDPTDLKGEV